MSNIIFQTLTLQGERKRSQSNLLSPDFSGIGIGADALPIVQGGSGVGAYFDFGSRALRTSFLAVDPFDIPNKSYVDAIAAGLIVKDAVRAATTTALPTYTALGSGAGKTLTATADGALSIDNVTLVNGDRILVKNEISPDSIHNGIYEVTDAGSVSSPYILTRASDFDGSPSFEVKGGCFTFVQEGDENADGGFVVVSNGVLSVDTDEIDFTQFSGAGQIVDGAAIEKIGNTLNVKVDDISIEIVGDQLQLKDGGVSNGKIANNAVDETKLNTSVAGNGLTGGGGAALAVGAGDAIKVGTDTVAVDFASSLVNDNGSAIANGDIVYIKPNGNVDLADKSLVSNEVEIGIVEDATISSLAAGKIITRRGAIISGFTGLVPGRLYHVSSSGTMDLYENIVFAPGEYVHIVGRALSSSELIFNPMFDFEY